MSLTVILQEFVYSAATPIVGGIFEASENMDYWLEAVDCEENKMFLFDCESNPIGEHNCGENKRAGVTCGGIYTLHACALPLLSKICTVTALETLT